MIFKNNKGIAYLEKLIVEREGAKLEEGCIYQERKEGQRGGQL